jgi:uncharacterized YccA/Bax inhibitor family protein
VRQSGNPAFRNLPSGVAAGGPYTGFGDTQTGMPEYRPGTATGAGDRPMTVDDVVMKAGASIGVALIAGIIAAVWGHSQIEPGVSMGPLFGVLIVSLLVGFGLSLYIALKQKASAALTLTYSAVEGVFLGIITAVLESTLPDSSGSLGLQAVMGTALVFVIMLVVYRTGAIKVTPKLTKWIIGAAAGAFGLMLINLLLGAFGVTTGLRGAGTLGIIVGIVFIGIAAFMLLLDFDMADNMIRAGMPQKWAWYAAFGLMATLVWLYFEILRLLWAFQSE